MCFGGGSSPAPAPAGPSPTTDANYWERQQRMLNQADKRGGGRDDDATKIDKETATDVLGGSKVTA